MLLLVIFLGLTWCILKSKKRARTAAAFSRLLGLALAAGVLMGVGRADPLCFRLDRSFRWRCFCYCSWRTKKGVACAGGAGAFALVLTPWIVRNFAVSGTPFGTAGFAVVEGTGAFPGFQLERSIHPDLCLTRCGWRCICTSFRTTCARHSAGRHCPNWAAVGRACCFWRACCWVFAARPCGGCAISC